MGASRRCIEPRPLRTSDEYPSENTRIRIYQEGPRSQEKFLAKTRDLPRKRGNSVAK